MKWSVYCRHGQYSLTFRAQGPSSERKNEGPTLETLDFTIRTSSTPTFSYFNLYLYSTTPRLSQQNQSLILCFLPYISITVFYIKPSFFPILSLPNITLVDRTWHLETTMRGTRSPTKRSNMKPRMFSVKSGLWKERDGRWSNKKRKKKGRR